MKRVHRTFLERFNYLAIYKCAPCDQEEAVPKQFAYHFGTECRCPRCGTYRVVRLRERDKIDPMRKGILNLVERFCGGSLYSCCFCRLQFYDRRKLMPKNGSRPAGEPVTIPQDTAKSGA